MKYFGQAHIANHAKALPLVKRHEHQRVITFYNTKKGEYKTGKETKIIASQKLVTQKLSKFHLEPNLAFPRD